MPSAPYMATPEPPAETPITANSAVWKAERKFSYVRELSPTTLRLDNLLEDLDKPMFDASQRLVKKAIEDKATINAAFANWRSSKFGFAAIFNRQTPIHNDHNSLLRDYDITITGGSYEGGDMLFPQFNLVADYPPGTLIINHGNLYDHHVQSWTGPQRLCLALFTHKKLWDQYKVKPPPVDVWEPAWKSGEKGKTEVAEGQLQVAESGRPKSASKSSRIRQRQKKIELKRQGNAGDGKPKGRSEDGHGGDINGT